MLSTITELTAIDTRENSLRDRSLQVARKASPAIRSKLSPSTLSSKAEQLTQHFLPLHIDSTQCSKHHCTENKVCTLKTQIIFCVLLCRSIPFARFRETERRTHTHTRAKSGESIVRHNALRNGTDAKLAPVLEKEGILGNTTGRRPGDLSFPCRQRSCDRCALIFVSPLNGTLRMVCCDKEARKI